LRKSNPLAAVRARAGRVRGEREREQVSNGPRSAVRLQSSIQCLLQCQCQCQCHFAMTMVSQRTINSLRSALGMEWWPRSARCIDPVSSEESGSRSGRSHQDAGRQPIIVAEAKTGRRKEGSTAAIVVSRLAIIASRGQVFYIRILAFSLSSVGGV
jgi:hypothetical protein